ncbi:MAG: orotidine-5'-phosphate decarboxylase [Alphaproteobacteria bacterium]
MTLQPRDRVFVALDFPTLGVARDCVTRLGDKVNLYKVGLELIYAGGLELIKELHAQGKGVFLDGKVLDIPNTVEGAMRNIAKLGAEFTNIHVFDTKTVVAARKGLENSKTKLLGVTVLTSLDANDVREQGVTTMTPLELVVHRAKLGQAAGLDGVVCSPQEASAVRAACGDDFFIVTPGIRMPENDKGDQSRVMTPRKAMDAGASHLVIGRPITDATNPEQATQDIWANIEGR